MAGMTSWIVSNLMSKIEKLTQFWHPFPSLSASSSSSSSITTAEANPIQERFMEDLSRLSRMLRRIQAVIHDAEEREIYDQTIQLWLNELREVAYDAEDVLEEYDYQVIKTQVEAMKAKADQPSLKGKQVDDDDDVYGDQELLPSSTLIKIPLSYNMAERIIRIIEKFDEIAKDREALQLKLEDAPRRLCLDDAMKRPPSSSLVHGCDVFGREDDKKKIIKLLLSDSEKENSTVIPIVGMGGVGKTTLAQLVYNDPAVCEHFCHKVWVCVSENFDVVRITKEIVTSILGSSCHRDNNNLNDLQCMLKQALLGKRFLLILDDVWNERRDLWEALNAPFSVFRMGKVIVTTRSKSVTRIMQTVPPHELGCLDEEKSWLLFQRHAFSGWEFAQQRNFEQIGRQITRKCGGLPLALKAVGGFLRHEVEEQIWKDVLNNDLWELEEIKDLILPALKISYNYLPTHLKQCFVYTSLLPKYFMFGKKELISMWIAQGYIQLKGRKRLLEDIAFEYCDDLERRSFFQCSKYRDITLHDMVHDLARSITGNEICHLLDFNKLKNIPKQAKHIYIACKKVDHFLLFGAVRSLLYFNNDLKVLLQSIILNDSLRHFGCLRVLTILAPDGECKHEFFNWISNLQHLRYLSIQVRSIEMAEHSLCSLYKLQTLKLTAYERCMLPRAIEKLINLRHLELSFPTESLPESICQLQNLVTLHLTLYSKHSKMPYIECEFAYVRHFMCQAVENLCFHHENENLKSLINLPPCFYQGVSNHFSIGWLKHLVNLRGRLEIFEVQNVVSREDAKSANLQSKPHIRSLKLWWGNKIKETDDESVRQQEAVLDGLQPHTNLKEFDIENYSGSIFPSWFGNPHFSNLIKISLINFNSNRECKFLPLSGLPSLKTLDIKNIKGIRRMGQDFWCHPPPDGCQNNFTEVHVGFPSLESLSISTMSEWEEWRTVKNRDFPSLKFLHVSDCHKLELLPTFPSSLEKLEVFTCGRLKHLALRDSTGSSFKRLSIESCSHLTSVKQVSGLTHLEIRCCSNLKSVNMLDNLFANLKVVILNDCPLLYLSSDEFLLHSVASVCVVNCPEMREWCDNKGLVLF